MLSFRSYVCACVYGLSVFVFLFSDVENVETHSEKRSSRKTTTATRENKMETSKILDGQNEIKCLITAVIDSLTCGTYIKRVICKTRCAQHIHTNTAHSYTLQAVVCFETGIRKFAA